MNIYTKKFGQWLFVIHRMKEGKWCFAALIADDVVGFIFWKWGIGFETADEDMELE